MLSPKQILAAERKSVKFQQTENSTLSTSPPPPPPDTSPAYSSPVVASQLRTRSVSSSSSTEGKKGLLWKEVENEYNTHLLEKQHKVNSFIILYFVMINAFVSFIRYLSL
jgi:hypothetical protein